MAKMLLCIFRLCKAEVPNMININFDRYLIIEDKSEIARDTGHLGGPFLVTTKDTSRWILEQEAYKSVSETLKKRVKF